MTNLMQYALCPNCSSTLQISQTQIEAKNGLVRCGHCKDIFDANKHRLTTSKTTQALELVKEEPPITTEPPATQKEETLVPENDVITAEPSEQINVAWEANQQKTPSKIPYGLLSFVLFAGLIYQILHFDLLSLSQETRLQPVFEQLNKSFGLHIPRYKNTNSIRILDRQLSAHPSEKDTLQIIMTIKNTASVNQDYPIINLKLSTAAGKQIAQAIFYKKEYLEPANINAPFKPLSTQKITVNFNAPKEKVSGYEIFFSF